MTKLVAPWTLRAGLAVLLAIAGCGGGEEEGHTSSGGPHASRAPAPPSTAYVPSSSGGPGPNEGFGSIHSPHPRLGGTAAAMRAEEMRRIAAIEAAHRPPGPQRLTGEDAEEQRLADWMAASQTRSVPSADDDACERAWDQHVTTTEAFHARRHDGLHDPISARDRTSYLEHCRAQTPEMQQCGDPTYRIEHMDECQEMIERQAAIARRRAHPTGPEPEVDRDPLDSFQDEHE